MTTSEEQPTGEVRGRDYRAPYLEIPRQLLIDDYREFLERVLPAGYGAGDVETGHAGNVAFRFVALPDNPAERSARITVIAETGTDRTEADYTSTSSAEYAARGMERAADPNTFLSAMDGEGFINTARAGGFDAPPPGVAPPDFLLNNGLLVYDASENAGGQNLQWLTLPDSELPWHPYARLSDPSRGNEGLLAIVYLTALADV